MIPVKICGLSTPESVAVAIDGGAGFIGFVFYPASPRAVTPERAAALAASVPAQVRTVALTVDPTDAALQEIFDAFSPDMIQLHGDEDPDRVRWIRHHAGRPVIKAIRVAQAQDVARAAAFESCADWILFDAKPPGAALPGGTGQRFDWDLLRGYGGALPWMLSGGLDAGNVGAALAALRPHAIDLSSGVEDMPGHKNINKIKEFFRALPRE